MRPQYLVIPLIALAILTTGLNDHTTATTLTPPPQPLATQPVTEPVSGWDNPFPTAHHTRPQLRTERREHPPTRTRPTVLPPRQRIMRQYRNHRQPLTPTQVHTIATAVGFTDHAATQLVTISRCESGHHPRSHFDNPATGDNSYGLMQINMIGQLGPNRRAYYGLHSNEQLLDPVKNLRVAWRMSKGGRDWRPWTCARHTGILA